MATPAPTPRLRGREAELHELGDAFGRLAAGHPAPPPWQPSRLIHEQ